MAEQMRPASPEQAPDPSNNYERAHPENEAGQGRLDNNPAVPENAPDREQQAVKNRQDPTRQVNAQDVENYPKGVPAQQPDHSMHDEEPGGLDMAPLDIHDPRKQRHPRREGKGGTP
ncbi:MAG TPA: hypothetical protein VER17_07170 [Tepidisphaeraceae bacterium]|nr:hypothetical protein [Tepidisphaeraceae bacterium]